MSSDRNSAGSEQSPVGPVIAAERARRRRAPASPAKVSRVACSWRSSRSRGAPGSRRAGALEQPLDEARVALQRPAHQGEEDVVDIELAPGQPGRARPRPAARQNGSSGVAAAARARPGGAPRGDRGRAWRWRRRAAGSRAPPCGSSARRRPPSRTGKPSSLSAWTSRPSRVIRVCVVEMAPHRAAARPPAPPGAQAPWRRAWRRRTALTAV